jgi:multidrug efflux pump subunit AcrA (membrane-fusion protein)
MTVETTTKQDVPASANVPTPPASKRRIFAFATGALLAGVAVVIGLSRIGSERHAGYLRSATERVTAGRQARITKLLVKSGDAINPGTPLLILKDASLDATRANQQHALAALEAELRQAQAKASVEIADRKSKLESEIFEAQLKLAGFEEMRFDHRLTLFASENRILFAQRESLASDTLIAWGGKEFDLPFKPMTISKDRKSTGVERDYLHELQERESTRNRLEASEAQVGLCEERLNLLKKKLQGVPAQINEAFGVNVIQTRITTAQTSLAQLDAEAPTLTITAKKFGTVGVFAKGTGETVGPMDVIVELFDPEQPFVMLEVSTDHLAKYPVKAEVELVFPGNIIRKGQVSEVPLQVATLPGPENPLSQNSGQIRLSILPSGQLWPTVPFGSHIEVSRPVPCSQ